MIEQVSIVAALLNCIRKALDWSLGVHTRDLDCISRCIEANIKKEHVRIH